MRILYIVPFTPWPVRVRSYNLISRLSRRHEIDLVCLVRKPEDMTRAREWRQHCSSVRTGSYSTMGAVTRALCALPTAVPMRIAFASSRSMRAAVEEALRARPDVIYVERWRALQYVPPAVKVPIVCDPTDSMTLYNRRLTETGRWWEKVIGALEYRKFRRYEASTPQRVRSVVFCSHNDLNAVRELARATNLVQIVNGVEVGSFSKKEKGQERPNSFIFTGSFDYAPNRIAGSYLIKEILPRIARSIPDAKLVIAGNNANKYLAHHACDNVEIHGFVTELQPYLAKACVAVAPMTIGAGVSNKIMEAFSVGVPVVATRLACGDLPVQDKHHLLIAESAAEFAECVVELLRDSALRYRLAANAGALLPRYDWVVVAAEMEELLVSASGTSVQPKHIRLVEAAGVP